MEIILTDVGKRYNRDWIFKNVNFTFNSSEAYVILGSNGSGKSTLLQLVAGNQLPSTGKIEYFLNANLIPSEKIFQHISFAAPYLELIEEYSLTEILQFHAQFKAFFKALSIPEIIELTGLAKSKDKELKYFSSGMKQRVRLALAILSDTPLLFLDEPTSNLDKKGIDWYSELIQKYASNRIVIVCSNHQTHEYNFCTKQLLVEDYK